MDVLEGGEPGPQSAATPSTTMLIWAGVGGSRLEAVRVVLGDRGMRATGSMIATADDDDEAHSASYTLSTDESGVLSRLTVRTVTAGGEAHVSLTRSEEGNWLVDHGRGAQRTEFEGALDADLAFSPLFNALPVRRVGMHRTPHHSELAVVHVGLPSLRVQLVRQTYRTVSVGERAVVAFSGGGVTADLVLDAEGLVLDYPGLARRV